MPVIFSSSILLAVAALVLFGCADFMYKRAADHGARPHQFLLSQAAFFAPSTLLIAYLSGALVWNPWALWGALAGLFTFIGFYNFSRSLTGGLVSINAPLFRLNFIVTAIMAILILGEPLTLAKAIGLLAALAAAWLLVGGAVKADALNSAVVRKSILRALVATLFFGFANFCHKLGLMHGVAPPTMLAAQVIVFMPATLVAVLIVDRRVAIPAATWRTGFVAALFLLGAFMALLRGLLSGEASIVVPIAQMGFLVTATLGVTVLREPLTLRKGLGLGAAVLALAAFAA